MFRRHYIVQILEAVAYPVAIVLIEVVIFGCLPDITVDGGKVKVRLASRTPEKPKNRKLSR